ncbi:hypothetical protein HMPREF9371_2084 [Neisseria shayeganii 871]|uniref:Uncharacterized protein n=1 Tax=Neisseria shayeganii 871 TaxID=1032488 RepID=G4CKE4_9NEIS|nr:hypothetical protein HMPREF9371_2084 [Neisseria shayeganii 871]
MPLLLTLGRPVSLAAATSKLRQKTGGNTILQISEAPAGSVCIQQAETFAKPPDVDAVQGVAAQRT